MPTYLCHGFRWYRNSIRVFAQFQDIEDAAPDWVIRNGSSHALVYTLYELFDFIPFAKDLSLAAGDTTSRLLKKRSRPRFLNRLGLGGSAPSVDWDELPKPTPLEQPPVIPKILLPPGSETIILPPGVKPPPMPPRLPETEEDKSRIVRVDPEDPILCNNDWSALRLLEEWDPSALAASSSPSSATPEPTHCTRPWAYVADYAVRIDFSGRIMDEIARYEKWQARLATQHRPMGDGPLEDDPGAERAAMEAGIPAKKATAKKKGWFQVLRDNMEPEGAIQWYVVVCDDEVRSYPAEEDLDDEGVEVEEGLQQQKEKDISQEVESATVTETEPESHAGSALIAGVEEVSVDKNEEKEKKDFQRERGSR